MAKLYEQLNNNLFIIAGPCVIESEEIVLKVAHFLHQLQEHHPQINIIFKSSFDKANRTSNESYRGPGISKGLKILQKVKDYYGFALTTDIHESWQASEVKSVADIIQIPAFLCRQTDILVEAGNTNKIINIKKGQFLSGTDVVHAAEKVTASGNKQVILTERGNMFGYNNLVVDFRNIVEMKQSGYPVVFDGTHSVQQPGGASGASAGNREYIEPLTQCANALNVNGMFFEIHPEPENGLSDASNMLDLETFEKLMGSIAT